MIALLNAPSTVPLFPSKAPQGTSCCFVRRTTLDSSYQTWRADMHTSAVRSHTHTLSCGTNLPYRTQDTAVTRRAQFQKPPVQHCLTVEDDTEILSRNASNYRSTLSNIPEGRRSLFKACFHFAVFVSYLVLRINVHGAVSPLAHTPLWRVTLLRTMNIVHAHPL
jgi:hypothetical protein